MVKSTYLGWMSYNGGYVVYKLYNCDCRDVLSKVVNDCDNPIIVSDPPFNIGYKYDRYNDKMDDDDYYAFMGSVFSICPSVIIHYPEPLYRIAAEIGMCPERVVSWVYNSNTAKQHRDIAFFGVKPDFKKVRQPYKNLNDKRIKERIANGKTGAKLYDWWNVNQVKNVSREKTGHPCQMPIQVMMNVIGILPDDVTIIDPFMGSGTTGVACKKLDRDFIGIEMSIDYYNISKNRIEEAI